MPNPFEEIVDFDDVTEEEGSLEDEGQNPQKDSSPEAEGEKPQPGANLHEMERRLREMEDRVVDLVAENSALKTQKKSDEDSGEQKWTLEQLKEFADRDEGKYGFDASVHYANQKFDELLDTMEKRIDQRGESAVIEEVINEILPGLNDQKSDNYRAVQNEAFRLQRRGIRDPQKAWEAAMFKVAAARKPTKATTGESPEEYAKRRAVESAGGEGAPSGKDEGGSRTKMTQEELQTARRMGMKGVFDPDPKKRAAARKVFLERQRRYEERRIV